MLQQFVLIIICISHCCLLVIHLQTVYFPPNIWLLQSFNNSLKHWAIASYWTPFPRMRMLTVSDNSLSQQTQRSCLLDSVGTVYTEKTRMLRFLQQLLGYSVFGFEVEKFPMWKCVILWFKQHVLFLTQHSEFAIHEIYNLIFKNQWIWLYLGSSFYSL